MILTDWIAFFATAFGLAIMGIAVAVARDDYRKAKRHLEEREIFLRSSPRWGRDL